MPPPRPATEARSGSLEPGRPSRDRSANTRHPDGRPHTPPADRMYATDVRQMSDVRQTNVRQHHRLMPPGRGIINVSANTLAGCQGIGISRSTLASIRPPFVCRSVATMRWLQLRFGFDSTAVRLLIKGH